MKKLFIGLLLLLPVFLIYEISCIPTTPAIANAFCRYDGRRRYELPLAPVGKERTRSGKNGDMGH